MGFEISPASSINIIGGMLSGPGDLLIFMIIISFITISSLTVMLEITKSVNFPSEGTAPVGSSVKTLANFNFWGIFIYEVIKI